MSAAPSDPTSSEEDSCSSDVVFIGATDESCAVAIERFAAAAGDRHLVLADPRPDLLESLLHRLPAGQATSRAVDFDDHQELRAVVAGAALVVLGAGPYARTSPPVVEACLSAKVPYLDLNDDVECTRSILALDARSKEAGIQMYVGSGASPGMVNVLAMDASEDLDLVERIDVCWAVGDERPGIDRRVLEHLMEIVTGDFPTWENEAATAHTPFGETLEADFGAPLGTALTYEMAHPEAITLPRRFPSAQRIRVLGRLDPEPFNGLAAGLGLAVREGLMTTEQALDFLESLLRNGPGSIQGWRATLWGMKAQIRHGQTTRRAVLAFFLLSAIRRTYAYRGGLLARVSGTKGGRSAESTRRTTISVANSPVWCDLAGITGASAAAFTLLALDGRNLPAGTYAAEDWVRPDAFYRALEDVGVPREEIVEAG